jgi:transaldolase
MARKSVVERLVELNPETEIWWDSSPLVYYNWKKKMLDKAAPGDRAELEEQLTRFFNESDPASGLVRGVTTNPPLSLQAIEGHPDIWVPWVDQLIRDNPYADVGVLFWKTYLEVVRRGSEMVKPIWEASNHQRGYLSGQVDPRNCLNEELMFKQALELAAQNPNVMIKCPGTAEGIRLLRRLTAMGIATNCTLCFILPQFCTTMDAVNSGLAEAKANNVSMYRWRSVITHMSARYEEREAFNESAAKAGVSLTLEDKRWASIAIFRKAYKVAKRRGYPGKMLFCSMRRGPFVDGIEHIWHLEKLTGGNMVFTCPPGFLSDMWELDTNLEFKPTIEDEVSPKVLEKLMRVSYFTEAYQEEMDPARYATLAPTVFTTQQFSEATEKMVKFVRERIAAVRGNH